MRGGRMRNRWWVKVKENDWVGLEWLWCRERENAGWKVRWVYGYEENLEWEMSLVGWFDGYSGW